MKDRASSGVIGDRPYGAPVSRRPPWVLLVPALVALAFLVLPVAGLLARAPWSTLGTRLGRPEVLDALRLSIVCATLATAICLVVGVPLAWVLARVSFPGSRVVRAFVTVWLTSIRHGEGGSAPITWSVSMHWARCRRRR